MNDNFGYRNLIVWQKAMQLMELVYGLAKLFPSDEKFALSDQLRRAVVSIASNIAEGCGRATNKDYAHFLAIARGSLYETMTQLEMAQRVGFIDSLSDVEPLAAEIGRMLGSLLKKYGAIHSSTSTPNFDFLPLRLQLPTSTNPTHHSSTSTINFNFLPLRLQLTTSTNPTHHSSTSTPNFDFLLLRLRLSTSTNPPITCHIH